MLTILAAVAAVGGALGLLFSWLIRRTRAAPSGYRALAGAGYAGAFWIVAAAALVLFLLTLPAGGPFSPGQTLGLGFLIGAALGLWVLADGAADGVAMVEGDPPEKVSEVSSDGASLDGAVRPLAASALAVAAVLLLFGGYPNDAIVGCALGAAFVAAAAGTLLRPALARVSPAAPATTEGPTSSALRGLEVYALAAAASAAGAWLGVAHFPRPAPDALAGGYWAVPSVLLAAGALALIAVGSGRWATPARALAAGLAAAVVAVVIAAILQWKLLPGLTWSAVAYGPLAAAFLVWSFLREETGAEAPDVVARPVLLASGAALLAILAPALAFREVQGYGQALTATVAVLVVAAAYLAPRAASRLEPATVRFAGAFGAAVVTIMVLVLWMRVFIERAERMRTLDFQQPYNLLSVLLGASACFAVLAFQGRARRPGEAAVPAARYGALAMLGLCAVAGPLLVAALWGERALAALVAGLIVSEAVWMLLLAWSRAERAEVLAAAPHVLLVSAALVAAQLGPRVTALDLTRSHKAVIVAVLAVLVIIALAVQAFAARNAGPSAAPEVRHEPSV